MKKKVFFIGMNRTATTAFTKLFRSGGYSSAHYSFTNGNGKNEILASIMKNNHENNYPIMHGIDGFRTYSDMFWHRQDEWIDGVKYFKEIHNQFPDAYFVLQTRELDGWLKSKLNHKRERPTGGYIKRSRDYHGLTEEEMLNWFAQDREEHHRKVREYFKDNPNFIEFDINEDPIEDFINFFSPDFILNEKHWKRVN